MINNNILNYNIAHVTWDNKPPLSQICIGGGEHHSIEVGVDKKFNWFQKKMIKWCFGFEVKENK